MPPNVQVLEFTAQHKRGCRHTNRWCSQCVLHNNGQHKTRSVEGNMFDKFKLRKMKMNSFLNIQDPLFLVKFTQKSR